DLRATNAKLRERTNRIVRIITGLDHAAAADLLQRCDGELKTALVAQQARVSPADARALLQGHGGRVGEALRAYGPSPAGDYRGDLVIGIDGGGSSTAALVASGDTILGRGEAGPSNLHSVGEARALQALEDAVAAAFAAAGRPRGRVRAAVLG